MDTRMLSHRRLCQLFPLRNKHPEYRRNVRSLLRRLNPRMSRSARIAYAESEQRLAGVIEAARTVDRLMRWQR